MGEAKRREDAGDSGPKKMYAESDQCPCCAKKLSDMDKEHGGKILTTMGGAFVICARCGNLFLPASRIKLLYSVGERKIIDPKSAEGQAVQAAASKIVLPGDGR